MKQSFLSVLCGSAVRILFRTHPGAPRKNPAPDCVKINRMAIEKNRPTVGYIIYGILWLLACPALILFLSGDWSWIEGWVFVIWFLSMAVVSIVYLYRKDPALLAERFRKPGSGNQKRWDKYLVYAMEIVFLAWFVIMPLDARRYRWTTIFPLWLRVSGAAGLVISSSFLYRSYTDNTFASPLIRIQTERKQRVVSTGVYGFVRHPMYLGGMLMFLCAPLLLSSRYGVLVGLIVSFALVGRIIGEEKMLLEELEGYADYKKRVRYRLIPFVW